MQDLIAFIDNNTMLVAANPAAFATFAALFGGGGFAVGRYFLTERIANLESRIARRDEEIKEMETRRLKTAEPSLVPIIGTSSIGENETTPLLEKGPDQRRPGTLSAAACQRRG